MDFSQTKDSSLKLWYKKPAEYWVEDLPLGNGHGQSFQGRDLAGGPYRTDNTTALKALLEIRKGYKNVSVPY